MVSEGARNQETGVLSLQAGSYSEKYGFRWLLMATDGNGNLVRSYYESGGWKFESFRARQVIQQIYTFQKCPVLGFTAFA
jgi:hypothetical protein